jgi:predicted nucleic acid-binding protein
MFTSQPFSSAACNSFTWPSTATLIKEDEPDNRILECAVEAGSDFIISADKDLLRLGSYADISIVRAADFFRKDLGN